MRFNKKLIAVIIIASVTGAFISFVLARQHYIDPIVNRYGGVESTLGRLTRSVCGSDDSLINCKKVAESPYSSMAGIPTALYGMAFFILMALVAAMLNFAEEKYRNLAVSLLFVLAAAGTIADVVLLFLGVFSVKALCTLCLATYVCMWGILAVMIIMLKKNTFNPLAAVREVPFLVSGAGRKKAITYGAILIAVMIFSAAVAAVAGLYLAWSREKLIAEYREMILEAMLNKFEKTHPTALMLPSESFVGDPRAWVTIHEFSDFLCPACSKASKVIEEFATENPGKVRVVFVNFPLDSSCNDTMKNQVHEGACLVARGGICAENQGKLLEYSRAAFAVQKKNPGIKEVLDLASVAGINNDQFSACIDSPSTYQKLRGQIELSKKLNVNSTPTIYINGRIYTSGVHRDILKKIVEKELQQADKRMFLEKSLR